MKRDGALVSVVVPVFNVEAYINRCVESIICQTYSNLEILLVDDGSTDSSGLLCDELKSIDGRIQVYHKVNGGLSDARNYGIEHSFGRYITFVDSDDRIVPDMIENLYTALVETGCDFAQCQYYFEYEDGRTEENYNEQLERTILSGQELIDSFAQSGPLGLTVVAWGKLYKRELFDHVRYPKGRYHEDVVAMCDLVLGPVKSVVVLKKPGYYYLQRGNSIIRLISEKRLIDAVWSQNYVVTALKDDERILHYSDRILFDTIMDVVEKIPLNGIADYANVCQYITQCLRKVSNSRLRKAGVNNRLVLHAMLIRVSVPLYLRLRKGLLKR